MGKRSLCDARIAELKCPAMQGHISTEPREHLGRVQHPRSVGAVQAAVLNRKCEECTSANLLETDWQLHRQLCLMMGEGDVGCVLLCQIRVTAYGCILRSLRSCMWHLVGILQCGCAKRTGNLVQGKQ